VASAFDRPAGPLSRPDGHGHPAVPTVDGLIGGGDRQPGDVRETFDLATAGDPPSGLRSRPAPPPLPPPTIADAFAALLADEEGHRPAAPVRLPTQPVPPAVGEDVIEEIVRRVVGRLALGAVKDVVADVVSEIAERLVREEIARIRGEVVARHDDTPRLRGTEDPR
jgi:hypothetical protein